MKKTFTLLVLSFILLMGVQVNAQSDNTRLYLSAHASTQGLGLEFKVKPKPDYGIRVGASILPVEHGGIYSVRSEPTDLDLKVNLKNAHIMFDWHPFLKETSFSRKVVATVGAGYFWEAKGDAVVSYRGTYNYGDIQIPSNELGELYGSVQWNKVAPYLGIGFENALPTKKFNVGFAVGTYYMGAPDATLTGTKFLTKNVSNQEQFKENMSYYQFLPVVQINLNFAL
ncbi:hypothetical protein [Pedobacter sp.]|uniref:hypothetical protein n=1 Tax=Pedobacter sp. TaxID=1411316 RepID=UPI003D7FDCBD